MMWRGDFQDTLRPPLEIGGVYLTLKGGTAPKAPPLLFHPFFPRFCIDFSWILAHASLFRSIFPSIFFDFGSFFLQKIVLGRLSAVSGRLGPFWRRLGVSWAVFGAVLGRLGGVLGAILGRLGTLLGVS